MINRKSWRENIFFFFLFITLFLSLISCSEKKQTKSEMIKPVIISEKTKYDSDDPAIWIHPSEPAKSLIIGTDKDEDGALYVFNLDGKTDTSKTVRGIKRPNNVDVEYGFVVNGVSTDIAVTTERLANKIRVFQVPEMTAIDNGGIDVFKDEELRAPMGIALYKRATDSTIYAIVSRKDGPTDGGYLWQYRLEDDGSGNITGIKVREFGKFSGKKEIEAIAVDDELGFVYYSDEMFGVRKYHADPDAENADQQLALIDTEHYAKDNEGISIYQINDGTGYILVSDQSANLFHIYTREGTKDDPHLHKLIKTVHLATNNSDGSDVTNAVLNKNFPAGLFVAMSDDKTFHFYSWTDIAGKDLKIAPDGQIQ